MDTYEERAGASYESPSHCWQIGHHGRSGCRHASSWHNLALQVPGKHGCSRPRFSYLVYAAVDVSNQCLCPIRPPCLPAGVLVIGVSLPDKFQAREYRFIRAIVFTTLGAWGGVPVTHLLLTHGHVWAIRTAFQLDMLMGLIYVVGDST